MRVAEQISPLVTDEVGDCPAVRAQGISERAYGHVCDEAAAEIPDPRTGDEPPVDEDDEPGLEGRDFYSPAQSTFANGMHAVVVETDPETAEIRILR